MEFDEVSGKKLGYVDALSWLILKYSNEIVPIANELIFLSDFFNSKPIIAEDIAKVTEKYTILNKVYLYTHHGWPVDIASEL